MAKLVKKYCSGEVEPGKAVELHHSLGQQLNRVIYSVQNLQNIEMPLNIANLGSTAYLQRMFCSVVGMYL